MKLFISLSLLLSFHLSFAVNPWPQPLDGWWYQKHLQLLNLTKEHKNDVKVVFIGDSLIDFWSQNGKTVWDKYYAPRGAYNYGVSGDRTEHVVWRIQHNELDGLNPKVVVLDIGSNNIDQGIAAEVVAQGVKEVLTELRAKLPNAKIIFMSIFPRYNYNDRAHATNAIIAKYVDNTHIFNSDLVQYFEDSKGVKTPGLYVSDNLHFTTKGYEVWYEKMEPLFKKLIE